MAVQNKPERPIQRPLQRSAQQQAAGPQRAAMPQRPSVQRAVAQAKPATVNKNILNNARSVYAHNTAQKPQHAANARFDRNPIAKPSLKDFNKEIPNSSNGGLPSHVDAVAYLDSFLARAGKIRNKA